ncbi:histidinol-phosphatase HisJ [Bacillus sp. FJAT-47783]|uniref:histidinol-phosphatase HisJ n=1 Tax=Bacillus sp. FJAT-47783 TaxID=2922712 RepID=UPI001FACC068|nr:histidinol-phosphatase HisJ [Bacillus sp. FJAT-47783]
MYRKDGHVHTPFCPHGSSDSFASYVEQAIRNGFTSISFTEHAPLPDGFIDPTPDKDSAMSFHHLAEYFETIEALKKEYQKYIDIKTGLEVDYISGFEPETKKFLNEFGQFLDDSILSVHFLKADDQYFCVDFDHYTFEKLVQRLGSTSNVYKHYYETVYEAVVADLGSYKPRRIGHLTLVRKFLKLFPVQDTHHHLIQKIIVEMAKQSMQLDVNVAGLRKEYCGEIYPTLSIIEMAKKENIPLIYGSDAHNAKDVGIDYKKFERTL